MFVNIKERASPYITITNSMKLINIPNIITCLNLLCGCLSIFWGFSYISDNNYIALDWACVMIILGAIFDFFDGMAARALKISSPIGKELDSLADVITFGVAPSVLCYVLMAKAGFAGINLSWLPFSAFIMAAFSALRLAKFNCDERQTTSFIGLPTPANALFWLGMTYIYKIDFMDWMLNGWILLFLMLGCSYILISEIPMFSLKIKFGKLGFKDNILRYCFVLSCIPILIIFKLSGMSICILLYIILSIINDLCSIGKDPIK